MRCVRSWSKLELQIAAISPTEVFILGPRFSNPEAIVELCQSDIKEEIQYCVFGYTIMEKIAKHIKERSL
jgi:hypothetical protein